MAELQATSVSQEALSVAQLELGGNPNALALRRPFDPVAHELDASFRLTRFADLKGWGCKVPQEVLSKLLEGLQQDDNNAQDEHAHFMHMAIPRIGKLYVSSSAAVILAPICRHDGIQNFLDLYYSWY